MESQSVEQLVFEGMVDRPVLVKSSAAMLQRLIDFNISTGVERLKMHHGDLPDEIIPDIDPTDDATHGRQQLSLFHGFYKQHQYLPQIISEPTTKHVFLAWLRPGVAHPSLGADDDLMRVVSGLRRAKADVAIHVRGDCGFGVPKMYDACEENSLNYTFGIASDARLKVLTEDLTQRAINGYNESKTKQRLITHFESWPHPRTVVAKAECQAAGTNLRFVVTSLDVSTDDQARQVYDDYIQRGESEQRNDELKNGLSMDRLSYHRFKANFWRLLLHVAACNLLNAFRDSPETPAELRHAQPQTCRGKVIKVAARIIESSRRIMIELSSSWPYWLLYQAVSHRASTGLIPAPGLSVCGLKPATFSRVRIGQCS
jgi:hypothetical protein